jgi:hypothetical protein
MSEEDNASGAFVEEIGDVEDPSEKLVCPHCIAPIEPGEHLCHNCGGPITAHAMYDPLGRIWAMGYGYRNLTGPGRRPNKLALIGTWLIFGSGALYNICGLLSVFSDMRKKFEGTLVFAALIMSLLLMIYLLILDRVTRNYFDAKRTISSELPPKEDALEEEYDW